MTRLAEYKCNDCYLQFEYLTHGEEDLPTCPDCDSTDVSQEVSGINPTKCHDPKVKKEIMLKRSLDHDKKHAKRNVERIKARMKR